MAHRFPRNFTLVKAAILGALILATQIMPQTAISGGDPLQMAPKATAWTEMKDLINCPTQMDQTEDQLI